MSALTTFIVLTLFYGGGAVISETYYPCDRVVRGPDVTLEQCLAKEKGYE